jgi:hypothetical protein
VPNEKPKLVVDVEVAVVVEEGAAIEPGERPAEDDVIEVGSEAAAVDSEVTEVDAESEAEVKAELVGTGKVNAVLIEGTMVLAASVAEFVAEEAVAVPAAAQPVPDTVTVDTTVTVTMLFVPMTTVGITIPCVEEDVVAVIAALDVIIGIELGRMDDGVRLGDVATEAEADEEVKDKI